MPVVVGDVVRVDARFRVQEVGTRCMNVYHFRMDELADGSDAVVTTDLSARLDEMMTEIEGNFDDNYILENVRITNITQRLFISSGVQFAWQGLLAAGESMPAQIAVLVLARSLALGHLGRKYLGPVSETSLNDGVLIPASQGHFEAYAALYEVEFTDPISGNRWEPGTPQFAGGALVGFRSFVGNRSTVIPIARTMRSRIPGRGLS